eukprot:1303039-Alexandrium_andersonii.AAC.1
MLAGSPVIVSVLPDRVPFFRVPTFGVWVGLRTPGGGGGCSTQVKALRALHTVIRAAACHRPRWPP